MEIVRIAHEERAGRPRERSFELRAKHTDRRVSGYASVWGSRNSYGEVFVPGAFRETLDAKSETKPLVMAYQHRDPVGRWEVPPSREDPDYGLFLEGPVSETTVGNDALTLVRDGVITGLSIGFWPEVYAWAEPGEHVTFDTPYGPRGFQADEWTIYMLKAELVEASLVMAPADDDARIQRDVAELLGKAEKALPALRDGARWDDVAFSMALLCGGRGAAAFVDLPDLEHRNLFARVAAQYAKHGKEPPAYARHPEYARIEFRHDEREVFHDRYLRKSLDSVVAGVSGVEGPLSPETRAKADEAIASLQDALGRRSFDEELAELRASIDGLTASLRSPTTSEGGLS